MVEKLHHLFFGEIVKVWETEKTNGTIFPPFVFLRYKHPYKIEKQMVEKLYYLFCPNKRVNSLENWDFPHFSEWLGVLFSCDIYFDANQVEKVS